MKKPLCIILVTLTVTLAAASTAFGAGFEVVEVSGRQLGNAFAGKAALGEDASTLAFNPAGMTMIPGPQMVGSAHLLKAFGTFDDQGTTGATGGPISGGDGASPGDVLFIPNFYAVTPVAENVWGGFGVFSTYGLTTSYKDDWKGRYHAIDSKLSSVNVNLSGAYKINDMVSVGAGLNWQRANAVLSSAIDFGSIAYGALGAKTAAALGFVPEGNDGEVKVDSSYSVSWGWNAGVIVSPFPEDSLFTGTRFGVAYRSKVFHELTGDARFKVPAIAGILTGGGGFRNAHVTARMDLPEQWMVSVVHELDDQWTLLADVTWTNWSRMDELRVKFDNPAQPDSVLPMKWEDTFRYALGAIYRANETWTFRAGVALDESPIQTEHRSPRIPTADRQWITVGVGYKVAEGVHADLSYLHAFFDKGKIDRTTATGQRLRGKYNPWAGVLGFQLTIDL